MEPNSTFVCPACEAKLACERSLDFHLSFACPSCKPAKKPKITKEEGHKEEYANCPGCNQPIRLADLNIHLDHSCRSLRLPRSVSTTPRRPPGLGLIENFISIEEESHLLSFLENQPWKLSQRNGLSETLQWGVLIDYTRPIPQTKRGDKEIPSEFDCLIRRFATHDETCSVWVPNNCNAQRYIKADNHRLTAHYDDRSLSGDIICNVSLVSDCFMTFRKGLTSFRVFLPRRSASVMARSARFEYTHEIANEDFLGEKRMSINFRQQTPPIGADVKRKKE